MSVSTAARAAFRWLIHQLPLMTLVACGVFWAGFELAPYGVPPALTLAAGYAVMLAALVIRWKDWHEGR